MFDFDTFYRGLFNRTNYFDNYLDQYSEAGKKDHKAKIIALLKVNIQQKDPVGLEHTITVADLDGVDSHYTDLLLEALAQKWHTRQEDIVMLLEEIKDPKSITILYETAISIPYEWDDMRALAKKCIWALVAINTSEAKEKIRMLTTVDDWIIREFAIEQLNYLLDRK